MIRLPLRSKLSDTLFPYTTLFLSNRRIRQHVAMFNIRGNLGDKFSLGAGPISVALGAEYRHESADQTTDPLSPTIVDMTGVRGAPASLQGQIGRAHV